MGCLLWPPGQAMLLAAMGVVAPEAESSENRGERCRKQKAKGSLVAGCGW